MLQSASSGLKPARHISSDLRVHVYHGYGTGIDVDSLAAQDIVFTTYETVVSDANRSRKLQVISWFRVILDEGRDYPSSRKVLSLRLICTCSPKQRTIYGTGLKLSKQL